MTASEIISAFTDEQVSKLTGISVGQLRYWDRTDFFRPEFAFQERRDAYSRIYSYLDVASLKVVARLRKKVPLQRLRIVKEKLKEFSPDLWRRLTLWVHGGNVAFVHPGSGEPEEVISGQKLFKLPLRDTLDDLDADVKLLLQRDKATIGRIDQHRRILHNQPVIAGTRIPVSAIRSFHDAGYRTDQIVAEYPSLTAEDIEAAIASDAAA